MYYIFECHVALNGALGVEAMSTSACPVSRVLRLTLRACLCATQRQDHRGPGLHKQQRGLHPPELVLDLQPSCGPVDTPPPRTPDQRSTCTTQPAL